ncbi:MAG: tetratricopeptide repeat protein [Bdellovibrionales bacterium]|nr:tetratricopeptide repeat protein [Bdellovibrionales bacterium]
MLFVIRTWAQGLSLIFTTLFVCPVIGQALPQVSISELDETTHLEFSGLKNWNYDLVKGKGNSLVLTLPGISEESEERLKKYSDSYVEKINVQKVQNQVQIVFELKKSGIEHFDYMTDDPSLLIVDLYSKATPDEPKVVKKKPNLKKSLPSSLKKTNSSNQEYTKLETEAQTRKPASGELLVVQKEDPSTSVERRFGAFDSSDEEYGRFQIKDYEINEKAQIASKQNIYLKFPPLIMPVSRLDYWMNNQPEFAIKPTEKKETKEAQLLYSLYLRGREAVFLKTYQYFKNEYPNSKYSEILQNLVADIYLKRWKKNGRTKDYEFARDQLSDLIERFKESPITQRNQFLLAYATLERGEALPALEVIQKLIQLYPNSPEVPSLRLSEAECLMKLKKYDDALQTYEKITKDFPNTSFATQAEYRKGDVAMRSESWSDAEKTYEKTLKEFEANEKDYANAHFNRGEALFWTGDYKKAVEEFAQFIKLFPSHNYGAYAMTRIGELFDILGASKQRVMGAYLESYFRYPDEPGAKVARMRMLSGKMKDMKPKAFDKALSEISELQKEVKLDHVREFVTILVSEGYESRGLFEESLKILSKFYQDNPNSKYRNTIQKRVRRNIASEIRRRTDSGDYLGALEYFEKFSKTWLQGADQLDIEYSKGRAYEQAGVFDEALRLYQTVLNRSLSIEGTDEEKKRRVEEDLPSIDQLRLRVAKVLSDQREYVSSYQSLKAIKDPKSLSVTERMERTQLMADLWIQRGDYENASEALSVLINEGDPDSGLMASALLKQAQVKSHLKAWESALSYADRALQLEKTDATLRSKAYAEKVEAQIRLGLKASAIATLQEQLTEFEGKSPAEYTRYQLGDLLFQQGDIKGAEKVWAQLKESESSVLWKIADEKLKSAAFSKDYSRYIDRIPAMSSEGENQ